MEKAKLHKKIAKYKKKISKLEKEISLLNNFPEKFKAKKSITSVIKHMFIRKG